MTEQVGSQQAFSQSCIPPDLTLPQNPNEYMNQLREQNAALRAENDDLLNNLSLCKGNELAAQVDDLKAQLATATARVQALDGALHEISGGEHRAAIIQAIRSSGQRSHRPAIPVELLEQIEQLLSPPPPTKEE